MRTALLTAGLLLACSADPTVPAAGRVEHSLRYTADGPSGAQALAGRLVLSFPDDTTVSGSWVISWVPGADTTALVGPQVGSGTLVGSRLGDTLLLQLNPENADHNVGLRAVRTRAGYRGTWEWVTFAGPRTRGGFTAERN